MSRKPDLSKLSIADLFAIENHCHQNIMVIKASIADVLGGESAAESAIDEYTDLSILVINEVEDRLMDLGIGIDLDSMMPQMKD